MINLNKIREFAINYPYKNAVITPQAVINWRKFAHDVEAMLVHLCKYYDISKIKRAAFLAENSYELIVLMAAFTTLRIPLVGIDYTSSIEQIDYMLTAIDANCIIMTDKFKPKLTGLINICYSINIDKLPLRNKFSLKTHSSTDLARLPIRPFESLSFTSGTSGYPKVVWRNFSFDAQRFQYLNARYNFNANDKHLITLPFYHVSATGWARLFLDQGATIILADIYQPAALYQAIVDHRVTTTLIVPHVLAEIVELTTLPLSKAINSLKFIIVGGKHFPAALKEKALKQLGHIVHEYYGSTETGINTLADPDDLSSYPDSVGKPFAGNEICIVDDNYQVLPANTLGRIAVHSYMNMNNYLNQPAEDFLLNGKRFILMADHGYLDDKQRLFVTNRLASTLNVKRSINIYALEDRLRNLPCIKDIAIIPELDADNEIQMNCAIVPAAGVNAMQACHVVKVNLDAQQLHTKRLRTLTVLPYSLSGKVKTQELKKIFSI